MSLICSHKVMSATEHGFVPQDAAGRSTHQKVHLEAQPR